jgi:hypothetical protein
MFYVADTGNKRVQEFSPSGSLLAVVSVPRARAGHVVSLDGIAVDAHSRTFVADGGANRIYRILPGH